ncbi:hypothetical protein P261_00809 [Lachnospiraceae bacterium TWA4]|nr:hypothetical protein P261_00809 [Lachnospiraceae bacterium TWA4]
MDAIKDLLKAIKLRGYIFLKWLLFANVTGFVVGGVAIAFSYAMGWATSTRKDYPLIVLALPLAGLVIAFLYQTFAKDDKGTNQILLSIRSEEDVPFYMAPLIFISTVITHLFGGSAGREGAALQMGGSLSYSLGKLFRINMDDKNAVIMCGMSAAFAALFGTPLAATIFALEVVSVGIMYYSALVPCAFSALIAAWFAKTCGVHPESFSIVGPIPSYNLILMGKVLILGMGCAFVSMLFCILMHKIAHLYQEKLENPYLRIVVAGLIILALTKLVGTTDYMGAGMDIIEKSIEGEARHLDFFWKMIFTALTLGAGYKGGEIVPSFFIGATFGCVMGQILGFSSSLCAAVGMVSVFCGVTNCPVTSLFIAAELFGFEGAYYYLPAIVVSYMLSGYFGLYSSQKIMYSKFYAKYINKKTV